MSDWQRNEPQGAGQQPPPYQGQYPPQYPSEFQQRATPSWPTPGPTSNGMAVAGFVCALVGLFVFAWILGTLGLVFGGIGLSRANRGAAGRRGLAIAAIVIGAVDWLLWIVVLLLVGNAFVG